MKTRFLTIAAGLAMITASLSGCGNTTTSKKSSTSSKKATSARLLVK